MIGRVMWTARQYLGVHLTSPKKERRQAELRERAARLELRDAQSNENWEAYFAHGDEEGADPIARSFRDYICTLLEKKRSDMVHPAKVKAQQVYDAQRLEVRRLRKLANLPERLTKDRSLEPPPSPELAAAYAALSTAVAELNRAAQLPKPLPTTEDLKSFSYEAKCRYGWAAHALLEHEFEDFFMDIYERYGGISNQVRDATYAFEAARALRRFPRLERALDQDPSLPFSYDPPSAEDLLRAEWRKADPIVRDCDPMETIEAAFADFTADDLHAVAHGSDIHSAPVALAVVRHPLCDWGSALEILHSYSASTYQRYWAEGQAESDFDKEDQLLFEIFEIISQRANGIGFRTRKFANNYEFEPVTKNGKPNPYHPQNWLKWAIPERKLHRCKGKRPKPRVVLEGTLIRPTFEAWREARH